MTRWFRFYDDAINDPKILKLSEEMRWHWVAMLCIASKNEGVLPAVDDIALMLRVKRASAAAIIAGLKNAGLLDAEGGTFRPHNWNGRQYKSDVSTSRVKRYRQRSRNVSETPPETEAETDDGIVDAGAGASASKFTEGSKALASAFWKALGFESPLAIPPEFAGVDWRAIEWEQAGWTPDLISAEARKNAGKPLSYHEKCFATAFARRQAPLPVVEIKQAETITVTHGRNDKSGQISAAGSKLVESLKRGFGGAPSESYPGSGESDADAGLLAYRGGQ